MKVLVTGAGGQLGRELSRVLPERGHETVALTRQDLDITDRRAVEQALESHDTDLLVNAAAYSGVDAAEDDAELAHEVNAFGPRNLAVCCERRGCDLIQVSTNYIFDGRSDRPYEPLDPPHPINVYGRTKLSGEEYVKRLCSRWYIVRTAGIYGEGKNFVRTMLGLASEDRTIKVKRDEYISPTYALDLAYGISRLIESEDHGLYHMTNSGSCSWYEFASEIFELTDHDLALKPVESSEYRLPAARPANGVLSTLGGPELRHWKEALSEYLKKESPKRLSRPLEGG